MVSTQVHNQFRLVSCVDNNSEGVARVLEERSTMHELVEIKGVLVFNTLGIEMKETAIEFV